MMLINLSLVAVGGFFGAITRFSVNQIIKNKFSVQFPYATLIVNLLGSLLLGIIIGTRLDDMLILFLGTGFLGAFTTFSTFKLESIDLLTSNRKQLFIIYNLLSYVGGITFAFIGLLIGQYYM